jgi:hypothetical protein
MGSFCPEYIQGGNDCNNKRTKKAKAKAKVMVIYVQIGFHFSSFEYKRTKKCEIKL